MTSKQLQYVLELYHELNFTYAAEDLGITQSSLSQYIKKIENSLGTSLFIRNGNHVEPTPAGQVYIEAAKRILDIEHRMSNDINEIIDNTRGIIVIGASPYICSSIMPDIIAKYNEVYPNIQVKLVEKEHSVLIDGIRCGEYDFCVTMLPEDVSDFCIKRLPAEEIVVAVPQRLGSFNTRECAERHFPVIDFKELSEKPFVVQRNTQVTGLVLGQLCNTCGISVKRVVECVDLEAIHSMVYSGLGCALIPYKLIDRGWRSIYENKVNYYSIEQEVTWSIAAFWRKSVTMTKAMEAMIALV